MEMIQGFDSVHLDEAEFGEVASNMTYNEEALNTAEDLGLMQEDEDSRLIFLQLPAWLPLTKRSAAAKGNETASNSKPSRPVGRPDRGCSLEELPPGFMGKLLVYKSGKVKMKIGDTLYDGVGRDNVYDLAREDQDASAVNIMCRIDMPSEDIQISYS